MDGRHGGRLAHGPLAAVGFTARRRCTTMVLWVRARPWPRIGRRRAGGGRSAVPARLVDARPSARKRCGEGHLHHAQRRR